MAGGKEGNTMHDNAIGWFILLVVAGILVWILWYYQAENIRNIVRWIRYGEMWALSWFIEFGEFIGAKTGLMKGEYKVPFNGEPVSWKQGFKATPLLPKSTLQYEHLSYFSALAMQPLRLVFAFIAGLGALWCIFRGPQAYYRSTLDLEGIIHRQSTNFPVIAPFKDFNPSAQPPRPPGSPVPAELPAFAEALAPEEWLAYHSIPLPDGKLDEAATAAAFEQQLCGRWKGAAVLAPYQQILLAAFCLKAARKRSDSDDMLGRAALCWSYKGGFDLTRDKTLLRDAHKVLQDKGLSAGTLSKCNQHAFLTTALLRALATAREEGGVLASAQFVWLRGHDRTLWYPLNNLGRQAFHMEALGAMAHYKAEKMTQRPIPVPKVEAAVTTMKEYIKSNRVRAIPELDYSQSSKRGVKKAV